MRTTAEEQGVVFLGEQFGDFFHGVHRQRFAEAAGGRRNFFDQCGLTPLSRVPRTWPSDRVSSSRPTSCVVKVLVEQADFAAGLGRQRQVGLRTSELMPTLQIARLARKPSSWRCAARPGCRRFRRLRDGHEQVSGCTTTSGSEFAGEAAHEKR